VGLHSVINGPLQLFHILQGVVTRHKAQVAIIFLLAKAFQNHFDLIIIGNGGSITWGFVFGLVRRHWEARTTLEKIPFLVEDLWDLWLDEKQDLIRNTTNRPHVLTLIVLFFDKADLWSSVPSRTDVDRQLSFLFLPVLSWIKQIVGNLSLFLANHLLDWRLVKIGKLFFKSLTSFFSDFLCIKAPIIHNTLRDTSRQPEVTYLDLAIGRHQDVCALQVPMHDVALVQKAERAEQAVHYFEHVFFFQLHISFHYLIQVSVNKI